MQQQTADNGNADSTSGVPTARRWASLLLGAMVLLPAGVIVVTSASGLERWLGAAMIAFSLYLGAGAFVPRLLRFRSPVVPGAVAAAIIVAALRFAEAEPLQGAFYLVAAAGFLMYALRARGRRSTAEG